MADIKFLNNISLENLQLNNAKLQVVSTDPTITGTNYEGRVIYNSTDNAIKFHNGSTTNGQQWVSLDGSGDISSITVSPGEGLEVEAGSSSASTGAFSVTLGLAASVAGSALTYSSGVINVGVDGSTIEVNSDALRIKALGVDTGHIAGDAINGDKIADNAIDSEHYTDGSIDTDHIGALQVTGAKIAGDAIDGDKIADNAVSTEHITNSNVTFAKIQNVATDTIVGRTASGTGVTKALSKSEVLGILNVADGAQVNVSGNSGNAAIYDNSGTPAFKTGITKAEVQTLLNVEDGAQANVAPTTAQVKAALNAAMSSNALAIGDSNTTTTFAGNIIVTGDTTTASETVKVIENNTIQFEGAAGSTASTELNLTTAQLSGSDKTITLPNASGTVALTSNITTVNNATLTVQGTGFLGGSGTFTANSGTATTISITHDDTSSQSSVNNSGLNVIQDVSLDGAGHVTSLGSVDLTSGINTQIAARQYSATIGNGSATTITLKNSGASGTAEKDHGLGAVSTSFMVQLIEVSTGATVYADVAREGSGVVKIIFASAPATDSIRVLVNKIG